LVPVAIQSFAVEDLFAEQLKALRAASLDRHLREISSSQGPEIEIDGRRLVNFSSNDTWVLQMILDCAKRQSQPSTNLVSARALGG
jgi:7-keto-8-aminopelargonate synthetase-like enzyme